MWVFVQTTLVCSHPPEPEQAATFSKPPTRFFSVYDSRLHCEILFWIAKFWPQRHYHPCAEGIFPFDFSCGLTLPNSLPPTRLPTDLCSQPLKPATTPPFNHHVSNSSPFLLNWQHRKSISLDGVHIVILSAILK